MRITVNTTIGELMDAAPEMKEILASMGMHCSTCAVGRRETLGQAAEVHGMDPDDFIEALKGFMAG